MTDFEPNDAEWAALKELGIGPATHTIKVLGILALRVLELERLHRAYHDPVRMPYPDQPYAPRADAHD